MQFVSTARLCNARISAQKARLVASQIREKSVGDALEILLFSNKKAASLIYKLLNSAIANAENNYGADIDILKIIEIQVNGGFTIKRFSARAKGRGTRILKKTSNIYLKIGE